MATPKLEIPAEYQEQLQFKPAIDTRSDVQVLSDLTNHVPVKSEKNIWAFWHSGVANMPGWCRRNVAAWVRKHDPSWTVRVLDSVPTSSNYALKFVPANLLPETFVNGSMQGPYTGPHSADFLRGALLYLHGGVFLDVGCILFRTVDRICWNQLADPASPYQVAAPLMYGQVISNSVVASRKGDPFIQRWHELFVHMWKGRTDHIGLGQSPLMAFMAEKSFDDSKASNFHWDFKVEASTVFEYITQVACWMRLAILEDVGDGFSPTQYWQHHVLLYDVLPENWAIEAHLKWDNAYARALDLLATPLDADPSSDKHNEATALVFRLLAESSMQKITHGKGLTATPALGTLWEEPENEGKDARPGTFAELLRWGSENFEQTRKDIRYVCAPVPLMTLKKGLLEP